MTWSYFSISAGSLEMMYCSSRVRMRAICDLMSSIARMAGIQCADSWVAVLLTCASLTMENTPTHTVSASTAANARPSLVASRNSLIDFIARPIGVRGPGSGSRYIDESARRRLPVARRKVTVVQLGGNSNPPLIERRLLSQLGDNCVFREVFLRRTKDSMRQYA